MGARLALDIGATTITARVRPEGRPPVAVLFDGMPSAPAAVCFESSGAVAGRAAVAAGAGDPTSFAAAPLDAVADGRLTYGGVKRDPADLLKPVLSMVLEHAGDACGTAPESIACVVPFGSKRALRAPMAEAAAALGLPEPTLISEPVAAVLHATGGRGLPPGSPAVIIDAGGNSLEVTALRGTETGAPLVLAHHTDTDLGGESVDRLILGWLDRELEVANPPLCAALRAERNRTLLANLRASVRRAKEELAFAESTEISVTTLNGHGSVILTRAALATVLSEWFVRVRGLVTRSLRDSGLPANGTTGCFVVGGGALLPGFRETLTPVGRLTFARDPLTAATDGALLADLGLLDTLNTMNEAIEPPAEDDGGAVAANRPTEASATPTLAPTPFTSAQGTRTPKTAAPESPFLSPSRSGGAGAIPESPFLSPGAAPVGASSWTPAVTRRFTRVWAGQQLIVAQDDDGTLWQWGGAVAGRPSATHAPRPVPGAPVFPRSVAVGGSHAVAVGGDGGVWAWGDNAHGQLGVPGRGAGEAPFAAGRPDIGVPVVAAACGESHTLLLAETGQVHSFGRNLAGCLGTGDRVETAPPTRIKDLDRDVAALAAGTDYSLALEPNGRMWGWGENDRGQISGSPGPDAVFPFCPPTAVPFESLVGGHGFTLALDREGGAWAWGRNDSGQLGLGTPPGRSAAGRIPLPGPAVKLFAGRRHAGAVLADGRVFAWGAAGYGQLGHAAGVWDVNPAPTLFAAAGSPSDIAAGRDFTVFIDSSGRVLVCGVNRTGAFGDGSTAGASDEPVWVRIH